MDLLITGVDEFKNLARSLREAGAKDLQREMSRGIDRSVKPLTADVQKSLPKYLPDPYAAELGLKIKVRKRSTGRKAGIRLEGKATTPSGRPRELGKLNRGQLRHMLFGDPDFWFGQKIKPKFWDEPLKQDAPKVRKELLRALRDVARKFAARG